MKRNAIIRIVLWSMALVVLCSTLASFLVGRRIRNQDLIQSGPQPESRLATVIQDTHLYKAPIETSETLTPLGPGAVLTTTKQENINGQDWSYVTSPENGWVPVDHIRYQSSSTKESPAVPLETVVSCTPEVGEKHTFDPQRIREIEIEWVAGKIQILPGDTDVIGIREDGSFDEKYAMVLRQDGDELNIQFCKEGTGAYFGITRSDVEKDLIITVPKDWTCQQLDISCAAATVEVNGLTIQELDFDGASGKCVFEDCSIGALDIDTASGDVRIVGTLQSLDCDAASANIYAILSNVPKRLDLDTMSGDLELTLPRDAGYTLSLDTASGSFSSKFSTDKINGNYVAGDGACRINFSALSGDITILDA